MKNLFRFIGIYVAFLIQSLFFENLKIFSCSPDIMLALVIIFSVSLEFVPAAILGAFAGILIDVMYGQVFGINLLIYMFLALLVSMATDRKNENSPLIMSWISFVSVSALQIIMAILDSVINTPQTIGMLCANIFVKGLFAAAFTLLFVILTQKIKNKKEDRVNDSGEEADL